MTTEPAAPKGPWTLVRARRIHTMSGPAVEAMVLLAGRVVATGSFADLEGRFPVERRVDLDGVVVPGFNDAHVHPTMTAENQLHVDCSPEVAVDEDRLVALLRQEAERSGSGEWVVGSRYDQSKTTSGRIVDRHFLDRVTGDVPTVLSHVSVHWGVLNSAALRAAGLDDDSADPQDGALGRDGDGRLNGVLYEQALFDVCMPSLARRPTVVPTSSLEQRLRALQRVQRMFHAVGLTSACDALCGPDDVRLLMAARDAGALTLRTGMLVAYPHSDHVAALGLRSLGDEQLRLVGIKAFVDGACAGGNCLVDQPFEGTDDHGMQTIGTDVLEELVARTHRDGVVLGVHANGDRAIRLLLTAHEKARAAAPAGAAAVRHRVEHCTVVDDDIVARMASSGLVAVPFGSYARFHGDKLPGYYGAERLERMFAHRTLLDAGIPVAGSSDYPCGPLEPLVAITSCAERRAIDGTPIGLSQRISVREAVQLYTTGSAFATGEERVKGTLSPGLVADFVELSDDIYAVPAAEVLNLDVRSTWVGGDCVYALDGADEAPGQRVVAGLQ
jgi:predicted amidohydrolase YtcJ